MDRYLNVPNPENCLKTHDRSNEKNDIESLNKKYTCDMTSKTNADF